MAMNGRYEQSCYGVFCAMVLDSLDGRVARMTNTQSAFGAEMDSLSDMVSFGAAPALIVYEWALKGLGKAGWVVAFLYCACAALRLARFNTNLAIVDKRYFQGLPSPAAAAVVVGYIWVVVDLLGGSAQIGRGRAVGRAGPPVRRPWEGPRVLRRTPLGGARLRPGAPRAGERERRDGERSQTARHLTSSS